MPSRYIRLIIIPDARSYQIQRPSVDSSSRTPRFTHIPRPDRITSGQIGDRDLLAHIFVDNLALELATESRVHVGRCGEVGAVHRVIFACVTKQQLAEEQERGSGRTGIVFRRVHIATIGEGARKSRVYSRQRLS